MTLVAQAEFLYAFRVNLVSGPKVIRKSNMPPDSQQRCYFTGCRLHSRPCDITSVNLGVLDAIMSKLGVAPSVIQDLDSILQSLHLPPAKQLREFFLFFIPLFQVNTQGKHQLQSKHQWCKSPEFDGSRRQILTVSFQLRGC